MLRQHAKFVARSMAIADLGVTFISFIIAYWFRDSYLSHWDNIKLYPLDRYMWIFYIIAPTWFLLLRSFNTYRSYRTASFVRELVAVWKAVLFGGLVIGTAAFVARAHFLSRTLIVTFVCINLVLLAIERFSIRSLSWFVRQRGYNIRNVVIVGTDETALAIAKRIEAYRRWGWALAGFIAEEDGQHEPVGGYAVIGSIRDLEKIVTQHVIDEVIIALPPKKLEPLENTLLMLEDHGINSRIVANMFHHVIAKLRLEELEDIPLLTFSTVPNDELSLAIKRLSDVIMSVVILVLSAPIIVAAMIAVRITSPGPVLFRQMRSGLNGRTFTLYKLRSMYADAESKRAELEQQNEMTGPVFKIREDPRVTKVGRFIRKFSIDELPQLWNVFKGDMSIVGPRPPIPDEVAKYERWQRRRLSMRPGLTCLWQISGRNAIHDFNEWARLDLQYIDTWSLSLDLKIFLKTIPVVLLRKGAE